MSYKKSFSFVQPARCWVALLIAFWLVASLGSMTSRPPLPVAAQNEPDPTEIWDMAEIKNPLTLNAAVVAGPTRARINRVSMDVIEVTFDSIDVGQGAIRIHGFVAIPTGHAPGTLPALVYGHGAGDQADEEVAKTLAAMLKAVTISFSGPGQGRSTGAPSQWRNWLNTIPDIRRSWLYQYAYSAMRAVTYLTTLPAVNRQKIGMTGISAGGLMTWIANGVDDRLAAAYPIMATGDFRRSLEAGSWISLLMSETGLTPESPPVLAFERYLDPIHYVGRQHAPVMLINGAQDEFFPITTTRSTYEATRAPEKRLEIIYDWDHGYYADSSRRYDTYNNVVNASKRILGNAQAWFDWHLRDGQPLPPDPQLSVRQQGNETVFIVPGALVAGARKVQLIYSRDRAYTFEREPMRRQSDGSYTVSLTGDTSRLVYYVEAEYPGSVYVSSLPEFPPGFVPRIRPPQ